MRKGKKLIVAGICAVICSAMMFELVGACGTLKAYAAEGQIQINDKNFPDKEFRSYVAEFDTDKNGYLSGAEIENVTDIKVSGKGIGSLQGIEFFTALEFLWCYENNLSSLDVSKNTALKWLNCDKNNLDSLDVSKNTALTSLDCGGNNLSSLDVSKNKALTDLYCDNNNLSSLDVSSNTAMRNLLCYKNNLNSLDISKNTALTKLDCGNNNLSSLDVRKNTVLTYLDCGNNKLTSLDMSANTALKWLYCDNNNLSSLNVSKNTALKDLYCDNNNLSSLDVSRKTTLEELRCSKNNLGSLDVSRDTALTYLSCGYNNISSLDVSKNTALTYLNCGFNNINSLDVSKNTALTELNCWNNNLSSLDVSSNTALKSLNCYNNNLSSLDVSSNTALTILWCGGNKLSSLDVSRNTALTNLLCDNNTHDITLSAGNTFDMSTLPGMDVSKVSNIKGGTIEGNILTVDSGAITVKYTYDCGNGKTEEFQLDCIRVEINATNFPDEKFRSCVKEFDTDNNGYLSGVEIEKVTRVDVHNKEIASLQGIEFFIAMKELWCYGNKLTSLDVSRNTALTVLACYGNTHTVTLSAGNKFDMATLPGMDVSKVSNITGGTIEGNILTVSSGAWAVTYTYDCGNDITAEFELVVKAPVSYAKVTLPKSSYTYTGSAITPAVTVTYGGKKLTAGTDYTVTYSNNKAVGQATVTIAGKGNYTGTVKKTFKIVPASTSVKSLTNKTKGITIKWKKAQGAGGYIIYRSKNGGKYSRIKTITSAKTVSYTDKSATTNGAKYKYKIVSYKKVGKTTYKSASSKTKTVYRISAPKIKDLRNKSGKKIAVKWTKNKRVTGYQIQYATNSKFKKAKTVTVKKASTVSRVIAKLKKNSTYRVRIRAYKTVSGRKYYSAWSSKKSVKITK